jgi:predicted small secreted protein
MLKSLLDRWMPFLPLLAAVAGFACLTGCNTVEGVGEDTQEAGEAIEETAEDVAD